MGVFACALIVGVASFAMAGVPDLQNSSATTYSGPAGTPVMFNIPNGAGSAFTAASTLSGTVDATITVTLLDGGMNAVVGFPYEDIWLESFDGAQEYAFTPCVGGATADASTDANGQTTFSFPLSAGGASQANSFVMVNGGAIDNGGLALWHFSPDINADGVVDILDLPEFAGDFFGGLNPFRSDFQYDGVVDILDVVKLAQGYGGSCP